MRKFLSALLLFCLPVFMFAQTISFQEAAAQDTAENTASVPEKIPLAYLVLDASNSMWGRIDGRPKIELAKEVLIKLVNDLPTRVNTGVTVYGHRSENDCADIQDISPIGIMDRRDITEKITSITPKGKSPLTAVLRHVTDLIKEYDGPKTIILISDGVEACGQDPCEAMKALKAQDIKFRIEVIGLDVNEQSAAQLRCIAQESGGAYQHVKSSNQVTQATSAVKAENPSQFPDQAAPPAGESAVVRAIPTPFTPKVRGRGKVNFEHDRWLLRPHYWRLIDVETGEEVGRYKELIETEVPAGTYLLAWRQYEHGSTEIAIHNRLVVDPGRVTTVPLFTAMRLNVPNWVRPPRFWGLRDLVSGETLVTFTVFEPVLVPSGEFDLVWRQYENRADTISFGKIEIESGRVNDIALDTSITPKFSDWVNEEPYYWGLRDADTGEWISRFYGRLEGQLVPPGTYVVVYRLSADSTDSILGQVNVPEGETTEFLIDSGIGLEKEEKSAPPQLVEFSELDDSGNVLRVVRLIRSLGPIPLKPGKYRVSYLAADDKRKISDADSDEVEIKAGELLKIDLDDLLHKVTVEKTEQDSEAAAQESPVPLPE